MLLFHRQQVSRISLPSGERGFTLLEMLVAVFIFSISLVSLAMIASRGVSVAQNAVRQTIAQFLAQEGIEMVESYRDDTFLIPRATGSPAPTWPTRISGLSDCMTSSGCYAEAFQGGSNSLQFSPCPSSGCPVLNRSTSGLYGSVGTPTPFVRTIRLDPGSSAENMMVVSRVTWQQGGATFAVEERKNIFNWF